MKAKYKIHGVKTIQQLRSYLATFPFSGTIKLIKKHWQTVLILALTIYATYLTRAQLRLSEKQELYEQALKPALQYNYQWGFSQESEKMVFKISYELWETYQDPEKQTEVQQLLNTAPITAHFNLQTTSLIIQVKNIGLTSAKEVRVFYKSSDHYPKITRYNIKSLEPVNKIKGGEGESEIVLEVDRIAPNDTIEIEIFAETPTFQNTQLNQLTFYQPKTDEPSFLSLFAPKPPEPVFKLTPLEEPQKNFVEFNITFDEGMATLHREDREFSINSVYIPTIIRVN